jgi:flagellar protein FliS
MNPYYEQMVMAASPVGLIRLLYGHAIRCVRDAREHLRERRIRERSESIGKAWAVLLELAGSLDRSAHPELADRLGALYGYIQLRLLDANLKQSDEPLAEALGLLMTLSEAWSSLPEEMERGPRGPAVAAAAMAAVVGEVGLSSALSA